nr:V-type ATP synthase subunit I [Clostridia bacterium]
YPILLRNNRLVKPYEVIVEMFSPPSTKEKDPTPLMAPFFFFFFGMMLSDVGYGFLLSAVCALAVFKFKVKGEMERLCRMLFLCGISSMIWGFLFGSFFGDMVSVLSQNRFNFKPLWFNPMDDAILLMIWSMIFGAVHLFAGMGAKAYILFQTGHGKDAILDIFPWYFIITGLGLMLGGYGSAGQIMAIAGAAVLILFGGRGTKNPMMRLFKGLFSLYDITGYFSDILSYTRILALVLATSVIAMVVNLLGFLGGPSITGFIFYVLVAILGHTLNLALSSLSAYVHTSRLQYVEFFSKFYEGGGRLWQPLKIKTKYVDLVRTQSDS